MANPTAKSKCINADEEDEEALLMEVWGAAPLVKAKSRKLGIDDDGDDAVADNTSSASKESMPAALKRGKSSKTLGGMQVGEQQH